MARVSSSRKDPERPLCPSGRTRPGSGTRCQALRQRRQARSQKGQGAYPPAFTACPQEGLWGRPTGFDALACEGRGARCTGCSGWSHKEAPRGMCAPQHETALCVGRSLGCLRQVRGGYWRTIQGCRDVLCVTCAACPGRSHFHSSLHGELGASPCTFFIAAARPLLAELWVALISWQVVVVVAVVKLVVVCCGLGVSCTDIAMRSRPVEQICCQFR